jgi:hypothetical protein
MKNYGLNINGERINIGTHPWDIEEEIKHTKEQINLSLMLARRCPDAVDFCIKNVLKHEETLHILDLITRKEDK